MTPTNKMIINSDDLDQIFKGISLKIDGNDDYLNQLILKLSEKFNQILPQEIDKKLLSRFQFRLSELMEKCKNQKQFSFVLNLQKMITNNNLQQFFERLKEDLNPEIKIKESSHQNKTQSTWQINNRLNKNLCQFYQEEFWRLYGILQLNEDYIDGLILYYQSKQENIERMLKISLERNKQFFYIQQQKYPQIQSIENKAQQIALQLINKTLETPYHNKQIRMFGTLNQNQRTTSFNSGFSDSPKRFIRTSQQRKTSNQENASLIDCFDKKNRTNPPGQPVGVIFSNQIVREKTSGYSNLRNGTYSSTPKPQKKISAIDLNQSFNQYLLSSASVTPKRHFKRPRINQNLNQTFYQQLFPSQRTTNRAVVIMRSILFNDNRGVPSYSITSTKQ